MRRKIWLDRASLLFQSLAFGWLAIFLLLVTRSDLHFLTIVLFSVVFGSILGLFILPFWWLLRPYWRMCWFWLRSPRPAR